MVETGDGKIDYIREEGEPSGPFASDFSINPEHLGMPDGTGTLDPEAVIFEEPEAP